MRCDQAKKLIPVYLDGELGQEEARLVKGHIASCAACQKELHALERSWKMLGEWKNIDPAPGYVSRFWTKVSLERPWYETLGQEMGEALDRLRRRRLAPVYVMVCVLLMTSIFSLRNYWQMREAQELAASLDQEELEMAADVELAENFDIIQEMDFLEDLEVIEDLDSLET
ncbi:MAG: zf-HC2 domain-containing protein [Candidatus Omnitrophica bacterium]|nr:zf-HC2 domain-containing protein [Candidatus Omnitrophota bacterium]